VYTVYTRRLGDRNNSNNNTLTIIIKRRSQQNIEILASMITCYLVVVTSLAGSQRNSDILCSPKSLCQNIWKGVPCSEISYTGERAHTQNKTRFLWVDKLRFLFVRLFRSTLLGEIFSSYDRYLYIGTTIHVNTHDVGSTHKLAHKRPFVRYQKIFNAREKYSWGSSMKKKLTSAGTHTHTHKHTRP